jgi:ubiquinone/menaquinone biosynthesis C-methylase UbiE
MTERLSASFVYHSTGAAEAWRSFSLEYEAKVFSLTSFAARRERILREVVPGVVVDAGCGPLGLMLREIARLPATQAVGIDFSSQMIAESRHRTEGYAVQYVLADNRYLPLGNSSVDTLVAVNSFLPETRAEVELIFEEVGRVLRKGGRLVAVLPSFEMSLVARDRWKMVLKLDLENHREWDTTGWQCFYTTSDIRELMHRYRFRRHYVEPIVLSAPQELAHVRQVYAPSLDHVSAERLLKDPLFEHLLVAER